MPIVNISIPLFNDFIALLARQDWYYDYSDDHGVRRAGKARQELLTKQADSHPVYQEAYSLYSASVMCNDEPLLQRIEKREQGLAVLRKQVIEAQLQPA